MRHAALRRDLLASTLGRFAECLDDALARTIYNHSPVTYKHARACREAIAGCKTAVPMIISTKSRTDCDRVPQHDRELNNSHTHDADDEGATARGAHLKLAQRHKKLVAGRFRGRRSVEPEEAAPGVLGQLAVCFTTNGALPHQSRITCELPDHGWRVLAAAQSTAAATSPYHVNAQVRVPQGCAAPSLKTLWHATTHTLEFTFLATDSTSSNAVAVPSNAPVVILVSGVYTPETATPQAECIVTAFEKLVVRHTAPVSTRGGQIIDGPCRFTLPKILPGQLTGPKRWLPFSCCPSAVSDVSLTICMNGAIPSGGKVLIELPSDGWDMPEHPRVSLRNAQYRNSVVPATWTRAQHALEITVNGAAIPMKSSVTFTIASVQNPAKETWSASSNNSTSAARITTLSLSGGVIDGPTRLDVARISELRDTDMAIARARFDELDVEQTDTIPLESLRTLLERAQVRLSDELYASLVVLNLPDRMRTSAASPSDMSAASSAESAAIAPVGTSLQALETPSSTAGEMLSPDRITCDEVLSVFAHVYAPAYKFGQDLRLACGRGQVASVREWISRGCDPNATDGSGWSALHYAADYGHADVLAALLDMAPPISAPANATAPLDSSASSPLVQQRLNVNARDGYGWTPLMCAAANGHSRVVETLLDAGADVHLASVEGRTALHWASSRGMDETVRLLLDRGADATVVDTSGWSALHCATLHSSTECATLLLERGASATQRDKLSYVPTFYST